MNNTYFYKDKPLFGMDIGFNSIKVLQLEAAGSEKLVSGYGVTSFDPNAIKDGVIVDPETIARVTHELFKNSLIGSISTRRVNLAVPASRTFNRTITLPKLAKKDLDEAVRLEAEQYIPVSVDELYIDYNVIRESDQETELLAVAAPKKLVDSYLTLTDLLGLEVASLETTISAAGRLFLQAEQSDVPTVLIDFGSISSDITIFDKTLIVTGTIPDGGDSFTKIISDALKVSTQEAHIIKTKYGLGYSKKQKEITIALDTLLAQLGKEIRRMIRYYEERSGSNSKIAQVVTMGGGANMPGLSEHLTNLLRLPVRMCDPWQHLKFGKLQPPNTVEKSMYVTVAGLALTNPREIFS